MATASETFNTADSGTLGPSLTWNTPAGHSGMQVVGNAARGTATNDLCSEYVTDLSATTHKKAKCVVKTFSQPSAGTNYLFVGCGRDSTNNITVGAFVMRSSTNVWSVAAARVNDDGQSGNGTLTGISASPPSVPFTVEAWSEGGANPEIVVAINGVVIAGGTQQQMSGTTMNAVGGGIGTFAAVALGEVEIDSFELTDAYTPITISNFGWPSDGIAWVGPFISSTGNVYVVSLYNVSLTDVRIHKATDPTTGFTPQTDWSVVSGVTMGSVSAHQVGDMLHVFASGKDTTFHSHIGYRTFNMATDSWGTAVTTQIGTGLATYNNGIVGARRSNGDVIVFHNAPFVTSMGKDYGRVAARRIAGGTSTGAATAISIGLTATTTNAESVEAAVLGSSDRVHLFFNQTGATNYTVRHRCVKSTENLDGTSPATAAAQLDGTMAHGLDGAAQGRSIGQPFLSSGGVLAVAFKRASGVLGINYPTSADTLTWGSTTDISANEVMGVVTGSTTHQARIGGAHWDGTNKIVDWIDFSTSDPMYDKDTGSGFGTDTNIDIATATQISSNVYQRGSDIVLAVVYSRTASGPWVYHEFVLRSTGPPTQTTSITPVTITLTTVALTGAASGSASRTLTPTNFTLTPVALVHTTGNATTSISPATFTLTPVALTGQATIDPQFTSISPVTLTFTPVALTQSVGTSSRTVTPVTFTLTPITLVRSVGDVNRTFTPVTLTLTPVALTATGAPSTTSISPAIFTLTAVALTRGTDTVSTTLTPATLTLTSVALTYSIGTSARTITPVSLTLTPVALVRSVGNTSASITPATFTLTAVALVRSVGTSSISISPAVLTLSSVALTYSVGAISTSISPVTMTLTAWPITGFTTNPGEGNILPAVFTLSPVALTRSVGPISTSITSVTMTLMPVALVRGTDTISRTITPVTFTLTAVTLTRGTDTVARTLTPIQMILTPVALVRSLGTSSRSITPVTLTLTAVALTYTGGTIARTLTPVTLTLTPVALVRSVGPASRSINPAILTLTAVTLSIAGVGGQLFVWMGIDWTSKPTKYWTGTVWVEKPMKVWTGSAWELV